MVLEVPSGTFTKPGWYRITKDGWVYVCGLDKDPNDVLMGAFRLDLVKFETVAEEVPLW